MVPFCIPGSSSTSLSPTNSITQKIHQHQNKRTNIEFLYITEMLGSPHIASGSMTMYIPNAMLVCLITWLLSVVCFAKSLDETRILVCWCLGSTRSLLLGTFWNAFTPDSIWETLHACTHFQTTTTAVGLCTKMFVHFHTTKRLTVIATSNTYKKIVNTYLLAAQCRWNVVCLTECVEIAKLVFVLILECVWVAWQRTLQDRSASFLGMPLLGRPFFWMPGFSRDSPGLVVDSC